MCGPLCEEAKAMAYWNSGATIDPIAKLWTMDWTQDDNAVFTYRGEEPRYWNQVVFGMDTLGLRRAAPESAVTIRAMPLSDADEVGLNYFIDAQGLGVQSLKRFLGFEDTKKIQSIRASLFARWQIDSDQLLADPQEQPDLYQLRKPVLESSAAEREETWMDEISLFGAAAVQGRMRSMEAYVNWRTGAPIEKISIQDSMLEGDGNAPYVREPLPDELHELWTLVAALGRLGEDGQSRINYFNRLRSVYLT